MNRGLRALNRATLARQLLLRRDPRPAGAAVGHLAGLQAQAPLAPYVGLWTRLTGFGPEDLSTLLAERSVVRAHLMRNTVHLVTASDYVAFRPLFQPRMARALSGTFGPRLAGVDLAELREVSAALLTARPLTRAQLSRELAARWPGHDPAALAYAATHLQPVVQVPPRGLWGQYGPAAYTPAAAWLAGQQPPDPAQAVEQLVLRYLAAYGPASVADIQAWSGLSRLREVTERLGPRLRPLAGPDGAELLDLPGAPRPDPEVPAPPRFLPAYDNLLLSFADRSRVIPRGRPVPLPPGHGATTGTLLVDGLWQADWKITANQDRAVLDITPFTPLAARDQAAIAAEGARLTEFVTAGASPDIRFAPVR
ncbi:MAG: winged helix DNA-binding domain-containing protein [Streptosporangiaceae bacterium]